MGVHDSGLALSKQDGPSELPSEVSFGEGHWHHGPSGDWFVSLHPRALETNYEQCRDEMELQAAI